MRSSSAARDEHDLATRLDGSTSYGDLIARDPAYRDLGAFADHLVWWDRPLRNRAEPPARGGCLVISAHPDDIELSMGGWLLRHRDERVITHAICFTELAHTELPEAFPSACEATAVRRAEAWLAAAMLGLHRVDLQLPDFGLRSQQADAARLAELQTDIAKLLRIELYRLIRATTPREIFCPAAIGNHPDHRIIFDLVLDMYDTDELSGIAVHFYEDAPYASAYGEIDAYLARFESSYLTVDPWVEEISAVLELKQTLCMAHRSQVWPDLPGVIAALAERNAEFLDPPDATGVRAAERFWTLADKALL